MSFIKASLLSPGHLIKFSMVLNPDQAKSNRLSKGCKSAKVYFHTRYSVLRLRFCSSCW